MTGAPWDDETPLGEVRDWLRTQVENGATCPCCKQFAKVYKRKLTHATARTMITLWHHAEGRDYVYLPGLFNTMSPSRPRPQDAAGAGDAVKGRWWKLMEQKPAERPDGSPRVGWWRLTDLGRDFVQERANVPKFAHLYSGRCLRLTGPPWSIRDALTTKFDYDALMRGV